MLVLSTGDIYQATNTDINPNYADANIEIVGSIEEGIAAAKWSPDEEVLALATNVGTFILLTRNFHPISETKILPEDLSISKHVSVGWGKKETQFQGRGAKAAQRDPTMPSQVDTGILDSTDNREVQISWRGDGEVVAVNVIDKEPVERRTVRVYTREGTLDSVSEPVDRLSNVVSWRPSGNLIAAVQRKYNESPDLVFFERNGLRRGEFSLRVEPENQVLGLDWNVDLGDGTTSRIDLNDFSFKKDGHKIFFDYAYITIHGTPGENGILQGYFELIGIPYSTSGVLVEALTFDKFVLNQYLRSYGVSVADSLLIRKGYEEIVSDDEVEKRIGMPCFVKPAADGSSFGVSKVKDKDQLAPAIRKAMLESCDVMVESYLEGTEISIGCYKTREKSVVLPATEVVTSNEFFDYDAKYN